MVGSEEEETGDREDDIVGESVQKVNCSADQGAACVQQLAQVAEIMLQTRGSASGKVLLLLQCKTVTSRAVH